jgi:hypothetical protein
MTETSPLDPVASDWHLRYVDDRPLRWLLRLASPRGDNFVWGLFLKKIRHHRHGLGSWAIFSTWVVALLCAFVPPILFSFHVWYAAYLVYLPISAIKAGRMVEGSETGARLMEAPSSQQNVRAAWWAMVLLLIVVAMMPPLIYIGVKATGLVPHPTKIPAHEISFLLVAIAGMVAGVALGVRNFSRLLLPIPALLGIACLRLIYPGLTVEQVVFSYTATNQVPNLLHSMVGTGLLVTIMVFVAIGVLYRPIRSGAPTSQG